MDEFLSKTAEAPTGLVAGAPRKMTTRDRLEASKRHLEAELTNINAALKALDDHPDIDKVLELVSRAL
jgi:hypothetical protein